MMPDATAIDESPLERLPARRAASHKGDFGRVVLVGGSRAMAGAIGLAGMAALRGGAGLVQLVVPSACQATVAGFEPSYMTLGLAADEAGQFSAAAADKLAAAVSEATVLACGPGLGRSRALTQLVCRLYTTFPGVAVFDADGLNALAERSSTAQGSDVLLSGAGPRVLTPHPGEFARLTGSDRPGDDERAAACRELAARCRATVVLKGHRTCISDGERVAINATGNAGMATGGTGDVLCGLLTALLAQGMSPYEAARTAAHVHGAAGDLAAARLGMVSLVASDLIGTLSEAIVAFERSDE